MIRRCDAYQKLCKYKYINPKSRQRQLKSSFIKTLFESKNVKIITFHCLQQLVHIYNFQLSLPNFWIYICIYIYIYIYISFTSNSTIPIKKTINKNPQSAGRLISRNHLCHQTKISLKERLLINSLEKTLKNLSSFSNERRVSFIDFLKEVSRSRDFCCCLLQSLGPRDETENFV